MEQKTNAIVKEVMTTMAISVKNRDRLAKVGVFGEDYNDVLTRILNYYETNKPEQK